MTTLRQAVQEYVRMRRDLGFKLHQAGKGLLDFATFMARHRATYITRTIAARQIHARRFRRQAYYLFVRGGHDHICTRMPRFEICCAPRSTCLTAENAMSCVLGSTTAFWDS